MRFILLFNFLLSLIFVSAFAQNEKLQDLSERYSLFPPSQDEYLPLLQAVENELDALKKLDYEKAYFIYTSKQFQRVTPLQSFKLFVRGNPVLNDNNTISAVDVYIQKNTGYYKGVITSKQGDVRNINIQLTLENGKWKILGIQLEPKK